MKAIMNGAVFLLSLIFLTACSSSTVPLNITAAKHLNEDTRGHSLPVIIRVYSLNSDSNFTDATFRELWRNDKSVLGNTLLDTKEYTISPNTRMKVEVPIDTQAKYIAVVALFRHPHEGHWRVIHEIPNFFTTTLSHLSVTLIGSRVTFE